MKAKSGRAVPAGTSHSFSSSTTSKVQKAELKITEGYCKPKVVKQGKK